MDNGEEFYINDFSIFQSVETNKKYQKIQDGITGYSLESTNILANGALRYFRKGGKHRKFSINISGFSDCFSTARSVSTGQQGITGRRENKENESDSETIKTDQNGNAEFTDAVADDEQEITIEDGTGNDTTIIVKPEYDGENLGTLPIVEKNMYGFKTTYKIDSDDLGFCYGNQHQYYNLELFFNNIGDVTCSTSVYNISSSDSKLEFVSGSLTGNFSSIAPGSSKQVNLKIRYGEITTEYVDVPINIEITDSKYERTWIDKVVIRFHKGFVSLFINSINFDGNSSDTLNGFFIYPDGRSKRFTVSPNSKTTVLLPWSQSNYLLVFSGAKENNEMGYSFCFDDINNLADLTGTWTISEINAFENNDSSINPYLINDSTQTIKAYLKTDDIDYYSINVQNNNSTFRPIIVDEFSQINKINTQEYGYDIRIHNIDTKAYQNVTATLISQTPLITISNGTFNYGKLNTTLYKTCYYVTYWTYGGLNGWGTYPGSTYTYIQQNIGSQTIKTVPNEGFELRTPGFSIIFDENCVKGQQFPLRIKFETEEGSVTYDEFYVTY